MKIERKIENAVCVCVCVCVCQKKVPLAVRVRDAHRQRLWPPQRDGRLGSRQLGRRSWSGPGIQPFARCADSSCSLGVFVLMDRVCVSRVFCPQKSLSFTLPQPTKEAFAEVRPSPSRGGGRAPSRLRQLHSFDENGESKIVSSKKEGDDRSCSYIHS